MMIKWIIKEKENIKSKLIITTNNNIENIQEIRMKKKELLKEEHLEILICHGLEKRNLIILKHYDNN